MPANRCDIAEIKRDVVCSQWPQKRGLSGSCRSGVKGAVGFSEALSHALPLTLCALEFVPGTVQGGELWRSLLCCLRCKELRNP